MEIWGRSKSIWWPHPTDCWNGWKRLLDFDINSKLFGKELSGNYLILKIIVYTLNVLVKMSAHD